MRRENEVYKRSIAYQDRRPLQVDLVVGAADAGAGAGVVVFEVHVRIGGSGISGALNWGRGRSFALVRCGRCLCMRLIIWGIG